MHPVAREYVDRKHAVASLVPPMPDIFCRQAEGVYTFQPLTADGRRYLSSLDDLYQADEVRVSASMALSVFDEIFDLGLRVV